MVTTWGYKMGHKSNKLNSTKILRKKFRKNNARWNFFCVGLFSQFHLLSLKSYFKFSITKFFVKTWASKARITIPRCARSPGYTTPKCSAVGACWGCLYVHTLFFRLPMYSNQSWLYTCQSLSIGQVFAWLPDTIVSYNNIMLLATSLFM